VFAAGARPEVAPDLGGRRSPPRPRRPACRRPGSAGYRAGRCAPPSGRWSWRPVGLLPQDLGQRLADAAPATGERRREPAVGESISRRVFPIQYAVDCCTPREW